MMERFARIFLSGRAALRACLAPTYGCPSSIRFGSFTSPAGRVRPSLLRPALDIFAGTQTLAHIQRFVDEVIVIPDSEILAGMRVLMERCKLFVEPSAGAAIAPLLNDRVKIKKGARVVPIVCGGNIDLERLKTLIG